MPASRRTLVVGFGNPLMADDGVGHEVVAALRRSPLPPHLRVECCDGDGLRLVGLWDGEDRVWIIDALVRHADSGSIHVLEHDEIETLAQRHATAHQLSLPESLRLINIGYPEMRHVLFCLWGVEPRTLRPGRTLSPEVAAAVPEVARRILRRLRNE